MAKQYLALVADPDRKDDILFSVFAENTHQARRAISDYYQQESWTGAESLAVRLLVLKPLSAQQPVQYLTHALVERECGSDVT